MCVEATSNGFIVDDTPPIFKTNLTMSSIGTIKNGTTVSRTTLRVYWDVNDDESFIETQHLSISSHMGGDFNLSSTKVSTIFKHFGKNENIFLVLLVIITFHHEKKFNNYH
jgi:hypothetical protein